MTLIRLENVSKKYHIKNEGSGTLRAGFGNWVRRISIRNKSNNFHSFRDNEFWAIRNVSFEVERGESVGILGPNGSGKTTVIKMLSRITYPTSGFISVGGKYLALIGMGAGFQGELTGIENIYLNGRILGMKKEDIREKLFDIVEFSGIQDFIQMPLKTYSAGMYVRLAFSIAIHMEPDILFIDEALSVGDLSFQRKSAEAIQDLRNKGVTTILVSHNLDTIRSLCDRAICFNHGEILAEGKPAEVIRAYQKALNGSSLCKERRVADRQKYHPKLMNRPDLILDSGYETGEVNLVGVQFLDLQRQEKDAFDAEEGMIIRVEYIALKKIENPVFSFSILRSDGLFCCGSKTLYHGIRVDHIEGHGFYEIEIEKLQLSSGIYIFRSSIYDSIMSVPYGFQKLGTFEVESEIPIFSKHTPVYNPLVKWRVI